MLKYNFEPFVNIVEEIQDLAKIHHSEAASYKTLDPDFDTYIMLDYNGSLQTTTVRDDDELVGYSVDMVCWHNQSRNMLFSSNDVFFVKPEYRGGLAAFRLLEKVRSGLRELGVELHFLSFKEEDRIGKLLDKFGYGFHETKYSSKLGEDYE